MVFKPDVDNLSVDGLVAVSGIRTRFDIACDHGTAIFDAMLLGFIIPIKHQMPIGTNGYAIFSKSDFIRLQSIVRPLTKGPLINYLRFHFGNPQRSWAVSEVN